MVLKTRCAAVVDSGEKGAMGGQSGSVVVDRRGTWMKLQANRQRANAVSVASEWYSAKRNKPSQSCEANARPCGIYKIAAGGGTPLCLGRIQPRRPFAHSRHLRCRTWRSGNGRRNASPTEFIQKFRYVGDGLPVPFCGRIISAPTE